MMTLMARLCALCAMSALMQLMLPPSDGRSSLRMICGMLMIYLTLSGIAQIARQAAAQSDLISMLESLMQ